MDPVTISLAMGIATKSFEAIKAGFAAARDIEQMSGDIGRWMGAVSDVDNAEKQAKNPPLFGKLFKAGSIEEAALAAYAAKKKLEEQRYELKMFLNLTHGPGAYEELLAMEGKIRKERQRTIYAQQKLRRQVGEGVAWLIVACIVGGLALLVASIWSKTAHAYEYKSKSYTKKQLLNQGKNKAVKYTTCRLTKRIKSKSGQMACIYEGGNKTYELMIESWCPKQYKCVYNPWQKEPNIDDVVNSLNNAVKNK
jgi:hypothetical protein